MESPPSGRGVAEDAAIRAAGNRAKWVVTSFVLLLGVAAFLWIRWSDLSPRPIWLPRCALNHWTGLHCPGCGNTRAAVSLAHGDFRGALSQNAFFVVALPFLILGAVRAWVRWVYPRKWRPLPFTWKWGYSLALIGLLLVFTVLRNLPMRPFQWLAPVPLHTAGSADPEGQTPPPTRPGSQ